VSRLVKGSLMVEVDGVGRPCRVQRGNRWLQVVEVLDRWYDTGCWWEGETPKLFFRLQLEGSRIWEVYQNQSSHSWHLYKIYD
jgi:hypothetical protein